jgi:hypothetical protein
VAGRLRSNALAAAESVWPTLSLSSLLLCLFSLIELEKTRSKDGIAAP